MVLAVFASVEVAVDDGGIPLVVLEAGAVDLERMQTYRESDSVRFA